MLLVTCEMLNLEEEGEDDDEGEEEEETTKEEEKEEHEEQLNDQITWEFDLENIPVATHNDFQMAAPGFNYQWIIPLPQLFEEYGVMDEASLLVVGGGEA